MAEGNASASGHEGTAGRWRVATFNANSIRARLAQVLAWLEAYSPDLLCIQETKVQDADFPVAPFGQVGYRVAFRGQKAYAGVALISREELGQVACGFDDEGPPDAPRLIRAVIRGILVVNTYVPQGRSLDSPHFQYKLEWFGRLRAFFDRHCSPQEPLLWVGDLNVAPREIDVHDPNRHRDHVCFHVSVRDALSDVVEWGLVDLFRLHHPDQPDQYTYWDYRAKDPVAEKKGWRIDHILATPPLAARCVNAWIDVEARLAPRPSDHTFLVADFEL